MSLVWVGIWVIGIGMVMGGYVVRCMSGGDGDGDGEYFFF